MAPDICNRGTAIEEEDFCHLTEKDVEFKCPEGMDAKLKKFYSWEKALLIKIELDGKTYCGCLIQGNDSFAPVKVVPPKSPLPYKMPSKPKLFKDKKPPKNSSDNAYSRENWPRVYIDTHNTIEQRLRFGRDKNISSNCAKDLPRKRKENSLSRTKKASVLVYSKRKNKLRRDDKAKNSTRKENSHLRRSKRKCRSLEKYVQRNEESVSSTKSNTIFSSLKSASSSSKANESCNSKGDIRALKSIRRREKKSASRETSSHSAKFKLCPQIASEESQFTPNCVEIESSESSDSSCQYPELDLMISPIKSKVQLSFDFINDERLKLCPQTASEESRLTTNCVEIENNESSDSSCQYPELDLMISPIKKDQLLLDFTNDEGLKLCPQIASEESQLTTNCVEIENNESSDSSCQYPELDLMVSPIKSEEIQLSLDFIDNESNRLNIPFMRGQNRSRKSEGIRTTVDEADVKSPARKGTLNVVKKRKKRLYNSPKSKVQVKVKSNTEMQYLDLFKSFGNMSISGVSFHQPEMQSSPKRKGQTQDVSEDLCNKMSEHEEPLPSTVCNEEMQISVNDRDHHSTESIPTNKSRIFLEKQCFIKDEENASDPLTKVLRKRREYKSTQGLNNDNTDGSA